MERVVAIVVTFHSADVVAGLLESFPDGFGDVPYEVVVVDNNSGDDTLDIVARAAPSARTVATGRNAGYAAAINRGVREAGPHTAVLVLNPDVRLERGCVPELIRALREPGTGVAVPLLVDGYGDTIESIRREPTLLRAFADAVIGADRAGRIGTLGEVVTDWRRYEHEHIVDWAEGSTQLVSAECWERCGPWDESFFLYSEETDFDLRARDAGLPVRFVPTARAVHLEGGSAVRPSLWRLLVLNRVRLYAKRHGPVATAAFWFATLLREATRAVRGRPTSRAAVRALVSPARWRQPAGPDAIR